MDHISLPSVHITSISVFGVVEVLDMEERILESNEGSRDVDR